MTAKYRIADELWKDCVEATYARACVEDCISKLNGW